MVLLAGWWTRARPGRWKQVLQKTTRDLSEHLTEYHQCGVSFRIQLLEKLTQKLKSSSILDLNDTWGWWGGGGVLKLKQSVSQLRRAELQQFEKERSNNHEELCKCPRVALLCG